MDEELYLENIILKNYIGCLKDKIISMNKMLEQQILEEEFNEIEEIFIRHPNLRVSAAMKKFDITKERAFIIKRSAFKKINKKL